MLILNLLVQLRVLRGHRGAALHVGAHEYNLPRAVDPAAVATAPVLSGMTPVIPFVGDERVDGPAPGPAAGDRAAGAMGEVIE